MIKSIDDWYPIDDLMFTWKLYYWRGVKYFLKLNRIPVKNYTGYEVNPKNDTITIYTTNNRFKMPCRKIEELIEVTKL